MVAYPKAGAPESEQGITALLAPLYEYPSPATDWNTLSALAPPVGYVIANPSSGPGTTADANWTAAIKKARANGITVLGYVDTNYGAVASSTVTANIAAWKSLYGVTSIFFDRADSTGNYLSYYQGLANVIHATPGAVLVLNHGVIPPSGYAAIGDILVVFENQYSAWSGFTPASWMFSYPPAKFCVLVWNVTAANMPTVMGQAQAFGIGNVFLTDEADDNWTALPSYLAGEAGAAETAYLPVPVSSFPQTVTGDTASHDILAGPVVIPAAGNAWEWNVWGELTTTVDTQTVTLQVLIGGFGILTIGPVNPSSGATITGAACRFKGTVLFTDTTHLVSEGELDLNYFFANFSQQGSSAYTAPGQLTVNYQASATAVSFKVNGGYWKRIS